MTTNQNKIRLQFTTNSYAGEIETNNYLWVFFIKIVFNIKYRSMWDMTSMFYIGSSNRQTTKKLKGITINRQVHLTRDDIRRSLTIF